MPSDDLFSARVGVIGAGLIGGSICRSLRKAGIVDLTIHSPSSSTLAEVRNDGFTAVDSVAEVVAATDVLFVCVPMSVQLSVFVSIAEALRATGETQKIVTDVASVKGIEAHQAVSLFSSVGATFVPGHPMAGTEESGFGASSADMFRDATWVLCPEYASAPEVLTVMRLVLAMQARVSLLDIDSHDRGVAAISHLPYLLAASLVNALPDGDAQTLAMRLAAGSFRDGSRVASSEPWLSASMVNSNSANVQRNLETAIELLTQMREALARGDDGAVLGFFERARALKATHAAVKSSSETEHVSVATAEALSSLMASCRTGALIRSVSATDDQWNVVLER